MSDEPQKKKRKRKRETSSPAPEAMRLRIDPAAETRRRVVRLALVALAGLYLFTVWLDVVTRSSGPARFMPRAWVYFAQISALFPYAKAKNLEFRAEGWSCAKHDWEEIDVRPYFPIDADNKESRFQRALQFYKTDRTVMHALDDYLVKRWNGVGNHDTIGGVRFVLLRSPYPRPGERVVPYAYAPLATFPPEQRHPTYYTTRAKRGERCGYKLGPHEGDPDEDKDKEKDKDKEPEP